MTEQIVLPTRKNLRIGVVSTMEHVKTLTRELKALGHSVFSLAELGDKDAILSHLDVIVCRVQGTSHRATSICFEEARKNVRPVIFRNGTTQTLIEIEKVMNGTWMPDARVRANAAMTDFNDDPQDADPEKAEAERAEMERKVMQANCLRLIDLILEKGGIFSMGLVRINAEKAKDVLCRVPYASRDRVKRTAVLEALRLFRFKESLIAEMMDAARMKEKVFTSHIYTTADEEMVLSYEQLTYDQLVKYVQALNGQIKDVVYHVEKPEVQVDAVNEPDAEETVIIEEKSVEPAEEVEKHVEENAVPEPMSPDHEAKVREIQDMLEMIAVYMDENGIGAVPIERLHATGFTGSLTLTITHMEGLTGLLCGKVGSRHTTNPHSVTCKLCRGTPAFSYAEMLYNRWNATTNN